MIYEEALEYIHTRNMYVKKDGLKNISALCQHLGNPQDRLKIIHIAGTNGKGSVAAFISNSLKMAGYRVGSCISPFVIRFNERVQINGEYISDDDLARLTSRIAKTGVPVTEFELVTAIAFLYFAEHNCDYVVLETGMGGRFDATNVVKSPLASVITLIDYDHMQYLGDDIEQIAHHKCGIIKEGSKVYSYMPQNETALNVIRDTCAEQNAELTVTDGVEKVDATHFSYKGQVWQIGMKGDFQPYNAALAIEVLKGIGVDDEYIRSGLKEAFQPCRFQIVRENPYLILDGAHNRSGCQALKRSIETYLEKKPVIIFGMAADKQYRQCIEILAPLASRFIVTGYEGGRAADVHLLKTEAEKYCPNVECTENITAALQENLTHCDMVVCGSLYLVSEAAKVVGI